MKTQGGLAQMLASRGADATTVKAAQQIELVPGAPELLFTQAAQRLATNQGATKKNAQQIRLYCTGGLVHKARGGALAAAQTTRRAGRGDDSMLLHLAPDEYDALTKLWGKPEINPKTGIPEYGFLSKAWKKVKGAVKKVFRSPIFQTVAPIALSIFAPWAAPAIGAALGAAAGSTTAAIVGNAALGAGMGAIAEGREGLLPGALSGGIAGGLGSAAGAKLGLSGTMGDVVGSSLLQGAGSSLSGGDFAEGALEGGLNAAIVRPMQQNLASAGRSALGLDKAPTGGLDLAATGLEVPSPDLSAGPLPGLGGAGYTPPAAGTAGTAQQAITPAAKGDMSQYLLPGLMAAGVVGGAGRSYEEGQPPSTPEGFDTPLPQYELNRQRMSPLSAAAYYTYGQPGAAQTGQRLFLGPEAVAQPPGGLAAATGAGAVGGGSIILPPGNTGAMQRQALTKQGWTFNPTTNEMIPPQAAPKRAAHGALVQGPGTGRSDDIDAKLSDGEYVVDAETVALLGDGSGSAGARRLDEMRKAIRQHKAKKLAKGEFTHKAKAPMKYMGNAALRRSRIAAGRA
jgi:hypothetical protein